MRTLLVTPFPAHHDSRAARLTSFLHAAGHECIVESVSEPIRIVGSGHEVGRGFLERVRERWSRYVAAWTILSERKADVDQVIAVNCEVGLVAAVHRLIGRCQYRLVLDVYDHHGDVFEWAPLAMLFRILELAAAHLADIVVLPVSARIAQYPRWYQSTLQRRALFIGNVGFDVPDTPVIGPRSRNHVDQEAREPNAPIRVVYCGNVDYSRGLHTLFAVAKAAEGRVLVDVHGGGVALETFVREFGSSEFVRFHGAFRNAALATFTLGKDLFWAAYDLRIRNNRYCDPNKFRDHVAVDLPILTNPGHPLAALIACSGSGFVVELQDNDLERFFFSVDAAAIAARQPSRVGASAHLLAAISANRSAAGQLIQKGS